MIYCHIFLTPGIFSEVITYKKQRVKLFYAKKGNLWKMYTCSNLVWHRLVSLSR